MLAWNWYCESFKCKVDYELLDAGAVETTEEAQIELEGWRYKSNK